MAQVRLDFYDLDDDALPDLCMTCGAPAVVRKDKTFSWHPSWVIVLIFVGLLPYVLVALILTKRRRVSIPFCEAHKNHWMWRTLVAVGGLAVPFLLFVGGVVLFSSDGNNNDLAGPLIGAALISLLVWLIVIAIVFATAIGVVEITDTSITLKNVGAEFARAYEESAGGYSRRPRSDDRDDWDRRRRDDPDVRVRRPGSPRPPNDAYEKG